MRRPQSPSRMLVRDTIKRLLQTCADLQDALWDAAAHARLERLPPVFQEAAIQWNGFADRIFDLLLEVNHTSPEAAWKSNPARSWMNPSEVPEMDDLSICDQCLSGLKLAGADLTEAAASEDTRLQSAAAAQLAAVAGQITSIQNCASDLGRRIA